MKNFFDWAKEDLGLNSKPWLILGKGPSYSLRENYNLADFNIIALNHVVRENKVKLANCIDLDVAISCADEIIANADYIVMPLYPHINCAPQNEALDALIKKHPELQKIEDAGKFLWYDMQLVDFNNLRNIKLRNELLNGKRLKNNRPIVPVSFFSSEAAVNLLAMVDVRRIYTLGVDGGQTYSTKFDDIKDKTLLANGQKTFSIQFGPIARTILAKNIEFNPMNIESPVRVFVGSQEEQMLAVKVLEYSLKKHSSMSVEVFPLFQAGITVPMPKKPENRPRTPFSFQRFFIPQLKGHKGRAIYMDSDMQVFYDIKDLWTREMNGAEVLSAFEAQGTTGRKPQFAVMLMDCEKLVWNVEDIVRKLDADELTYETLMFEMKVAKEVRPELEREWNSLEHYEEGKTKNLHYTDMNSQPWLTTGNKNSEVWVKGLLEAIESEFITYEYVKEQVKLLNVRPSLLAQVKNKSSKEPSFIAKMLDRFFIPPHKRTPETNLSKAHKAASAAMFLY